MKIIENVTIKINRETKNTHNMIDNSSDMRSDGGGADGGDVNGGSGGE